MPEIKAHYYIENISLHKKHPRDGGVLVIPTDISTGNKDASKLIECIGHVKVDILGFFVLDCELAFCKVRSTNNLMGDEVEGWTWKDNVQIKFDEAKFDGRFNLEYHDKVEIVMEDSHE